jgi:hypothetical protein
MMSKAEELRQKLIKIDVAIEELETEKKDLEDLYYSMEEEATYE